MKKYLLTILAVSMLAMPAFAQAAPEPEVTVKLPISDMNLILRELGKLPWADANATMVRIINQVNPQMQPKPADPPK